MSRRRRGALIVCGVALLLSALYGAYIGLVRLPFSKYARISNGYTVLIDRYEVLVESGAIVEREDAFTPPPGRGLREGIAASPAEFMGRGIFDIPEPGASYASGAIMLMVYSSAGAGVVCLVAGIKRPRGRPDAEEAAGDL